MILTKEEIKFIDNYLLNEGVDYLDVRAEMVDHVASGVEFEIVESQVSFYEAFKSYMIIHKKELLRYNKQFLRGVDLNLLKAFFLKVLSLEFILIFLLSYLLMSFLVLNLNSVKMINAISITISIVGGILYFVIFYRKKEFNFSAIQRLGLMFVILFQLGTSLGKYLFSINSLQELDGNMFYVLVVFNSILLAVYGIMLRTGIAYKKYYEEQFIG
ncbi:hypothetical protein [Joostella sp. CR20]|uniref:hypothetical protein n=1 Tax=Joostella sp. CR20 TaxID=2804312 RepID=UPI00313DBBB3